jgi:mono/diheme cytochrome c family protein
MKNIQLILALVLVAGTNACTFKHSSPNWVFSPDMHYSAGLKAQEEGSMRPPVAGTIPRGFKPYSINNIDEAGRVLKNPLAATKSVMMEGKNLYNTYCIVCHGQYGEGDGSVIPKYPRPPSLQSDKIIGYKDGQIYHVITLGQNLMPSYADKLNESERWSLIHYLRALQKAKHPTAADLKKAEGFVEENL